MSDMARAGSPEITGAVASAKDEAALEAVRVAALGKSGSVSALLKTLGSMTPDERKVQGPAINGLKDRVTAAIAAAQGRARRRQRSMPGSTPRPSTSRCRCARRRPRPAACIRSAR